MILGNSVSVAKFHLGNYWITEPNYRAPTFDNSIVDFLIFDALDHGSVKISAGQIGGRNISQRVRRRRSFLHPNFRQAQGRNIGTLERKLSQLITLIEKAPQTRTAPKNECLNFGTLRRRASTILSDQFYCTSKLTFISSLSYLYDLATFSFHLPPTPPQHQSTHPHAHRGENKLDLCTQLYTQIGSGQSIPVQ